MDGIGLKIDHDVKENKSVKLMGDFQINYMHPFEKAKLDTILTPYNLNVLKNGDSNGTTNNSHSLIDYFIGDSFVDVNPCFMGDSCYKTCFKGDSWS